MNIIGMDFRLLIKFVGCSGNMELLVINCRLGSCCNICFVINDSFNWVS